MLLHCGIIQLMPDMTARRGVPPEVTERNQSLTNVRAHLDRYFGCRNWVSDYDRPERYGERQLVTEALEKWSIGLDPEVLGKLGITISEHDRMDLRVNGQVVAHTYDCGLCKSYAKCSDCPVQRISGETCHHSFAQFINHNDRIPMIQQLNSILDKM